MGVEFVLQSPGAGRPALEHEELQQQQFCTAWLCSFLCAATYWVSGFRAQSRGRIIWWSALGIPAVLIEWVLRVDPRWDRVAQKLWVCSAVQDSHEGVDLVHSVLLFMMRWRDFSNTRWAGVGPSTRRIILSLAVGLEAMVQEVDRDGKANDRYYLSAAKTRLGSETTKNGCHRLLEFVPAGKFELGALSG